LDDLEGYRGDFSLSTTNGGKIDIHQYPESPVLFDIEVCQNIDRITYDSAEAGFRFWPRGVQAPLPASFFLKSLTFVRFLSYKSSQQKKMSGY
jgi:hypothetical protein